MINPVSCCHDPVSGATSKRPASDHGLYSGQQLMMCSADALAHPVGKLRCLPVHTSSWMTCSSRPLPPCVDGLALSIRALEDLLSLHFLQCDQVRDDVIGRVLKSLLLLPRSHNPIICGPVHRDSQARLVTNYFYFVTLLE